ncbi:hypothetical protein CEXT_468041 [Caerostris extrusa]|uniref:Uncharacterized protein n=1 Tax=Caerostris extrusa TaxID=172846 RepID=A0AAV4XMJ7_CAEEX|nr:hypothetical protein CEXT_468041 [Caerostris extrusa]
MSDAKLPDAKKNYQKSTFSSNCSEGKPVINFDLFRSDSRGFLEHIRMSTLLSNFEYWEGPPPVFLEWDGLSMIYSNINSETQRQSVIGRFKEDQTHASGNCFGTSLGVGT